MEYHRLLALWAADGAEHVLHLFTAQRPDDPRPQHAIDTAQAWAMGESKVGAARAAKNEHARQLAQLPLVIRDLVLSTFETKFSFLQLDKDGT